MGHPALLFLTVLLAPRSPGSRAAALAGAPCCPSSEARAEAPLVVHCGTPVRVTHTAPARARHHPRVLWGLLGSSLPWPCILQVHTALRRGMKCSCSPKPTLHIQQGRRLQGFPWHLTLLPTKPVLKAKRGFCSGGCSLGFILPASSSLDSSTMSSGDQRGQPARVARVCPAGLCTQALHHAAQQHRGAAGGVRWSRAPAVAGGVPRSGSSGCLGSSSAAQGCFGVCV